MRLSSREWLLLAFSVAVLTTVAVFVFIGGSSQQTEPIVDLLGTGHSVRFSESTITLHNVHGLCSGGQQDPLYWQNETGATQQVDQIDGQPLDDDFTLQSGEGIGECETPGTYTFSLQSNHGAKLVVTVEAH
jgi:hypothetical protein